MNNTEALTIFRTIQKCRHQALHTNDCGNCERCQYYLEQEQIDGAVALAISALEKHERNRWHVVAEEGNPPKMGFYLWFAMGGAVEIDFFDGEKWEKASTYLYEVLAWKYRPKAYREEEA